MSDLDRMTTEEWLDALRYAHSIRATFIYRVFQEMRTELGEEKALNMIGKACRQMGLAKRERYRAQLTDDRPGTFCDLFCNHSPVARKLFEMEVGPDEEKTASAFLNRCTLLDGWRKLNVPPDDLEKLCRATREIDYGTIEGAGFTGEFTELMSRGDARCHLIVEKAPKKEE